MSVSFTTTLRQAETKNAAGIVVPVTLVAELGGGKAPLVVVTVNGYTYRGKVAVYDGECMIGFSSEHRTATGIVGGDAISVTLELDLAPRVVEVPDDLARALAQAGVTEAFASLAPSRKKEFVRQVEEAKTEETRQRRIAKVVQSVG
jgi:hypothetical protein